MAKNSSLPIVIASVSLGLLVLAVPLYLKQKKKRYPPGPTPEFFVGNARQLPKSHPWLQYSKWAEQYGKCNGITSLTLLLNISHM